MDYKIWYNQTTNNNYNSQPHSQRGVLDKTLCDKVCQLLVTGWWFSPGALVSSANKTDRYDITEILLKWR